MRRARVAATMITVDANEAVADVAYRLNEVIAIYPITPASPMGEHADAWANGRRPNLWSDVPRIVEMQSEGGAAGAVHGALQAGSLATTFTASQGLLLMLPNMYKIAGELSPCVIHVAARTIATHALSIFGDHSDVYSARGTGFAMLASGSVQEAHDFALLSQVITLESRVPMLHFFDGFRTSHEVAKIDRLPDEELRSAIDDDWVNALRTRALSPDHPVIRGTAHNPDTYFQAREAAESFYRAVPDIASRAMAKFGARTGRHYGLLDYVGDPEAELVVVLMGSAAETTHETVEWLRARGQKVGVLKVRLYRPFPASALVDALPKSARRIAVLDRTKEPGAVGEPLYLDALAALARHAAETGSAMPLLAGGRYGLSSKELTPAMVKAVFDELAREKPRHGFTLGIVDDVTHTSLDFDRGLDIEPDDVTRAVFYGLGSDGTVGANKNSIKIIGDGTPKHAQGYFVYDSKKAGAVTVSHLRFGPRPIRSSYLVRSATFVACHQWGFLEQFDVLAPAMKGGTFLLNSPYGPDEVWAHLPREIQHEIRAKELTFYVIDAYAVAQEVGLGRRINTIMQTCFFELSGVLPSEAATKAIKDAIFKSYGSRGDAVVRRNNAAVDSALAHLRQVNVPSSAPEGRPRPPVVPERAPDFVQRVTAAILAGHGDQLPVSAFPPDGTWPVATAQWEKRNIALNIPVWDEKLCIQCNKCALVCPHAAIRAKVYPSPALSGAPEGYKASPYKETALGTDLAYTIQVAPEDCTGCTLCVEVCPAKDKANPRHKALEMELQAPRREAERARYDFFLELPEIDRRKLSQSVKHSQLMRPLFEYSGACAGCGETPYVKLLTQLFGDHLIIANATGCSSIYGGNLPTTPYAVDDTGRGPAWSNSLFEDNAEFGLGMRLSADHQTRVARDLLRTLAPELGPELAADILAAPEASESDRHDQRERVAELHRRLYLLPHPRAKRLKALADALVHKSVWIVGGDGWAYDIGYGGLDHVLASGENINILVLDTEVYSNTGGQASKATPLGAVAKFAAGGKAVPQKDLALLAMSYGHVYVARVAFGANDKHTVNAFNEAESFEGPSLILAYSHCIAHGYDLSHGLSQQKLAVDTGHFPLLRYDPRRAEKGLTALHLDSPAPKAPLEKFAYNETRFRLLTQTDPERARKLMEAAHEEVAARYALYRQLAAGPVSNQ